MKNIGQQLRRTFSTKYNFYFNISTELYEKVRNRYLYLHFPVSSRIQESFRLNSKTMENIKKEIIK